MKTQTIENLISDYLGQVKMATDLLESAFGTKNILGLWHSKKSHNAGKSLMTRPTNYMELVAEFTYPIYVLTSTTVPTGGLTASTHGDFTCMHAKFQKNTKNTLTKRRPSRSSAST